MMRQVGVHELALDLPHQRLEAAPLQALEERLASERPPVPSCPPANK
jgi:hypothetical protein